MGTGTKSSRAGVVRVEEADFDLSLTGFDDEGWPNLAEQDAAQGLTDEDAVPELPTTPTSRRRLWPLGTISSWSATPPIGPTSPVSWAATPRTSYSPTPRTTWITRATRGPAQDPGRSDDRCRVPAIPEAAFRSYRGIVKPGASIYVCHSSSWQREFQNALESAASSVRCQIIWAKNTFAWGFGRYKFQHEPIFYATSLARRIPGTATNRNPRSGRRTSRRPTGCTQR